MKTGWVVRTSVNSAIVTGGYFASGTNASDNIYFLIRKDGKWILVKDTFTSVS